MQRLFWALALVGSVWWWADAPRLFLRAPRPARETGDSSFGSYSRQPPAASPLGRREVLSGGLAALVAPAMPRPAWAAETSLAGRSLQACTQPGDGQTTGWTRTGSCAWDPSDFGFHQVCVTVSEQFLESSKTNDRNDLSSVVQPGGHWCICAWACASAVQRDPSRIQGLELDCSRTNSRLREVYQAYIDAGEKLRSPSGVSYEASAALKYVNGFCT